MGYLRGEFLDLDAVEAVHVQQHQLVHVHHLLAFQLSSDHGDLQFAQLAVGDHQKIAAAAGGVQEAQFAELLVEPVQLGLAALHFLELGPEFIEEERLDELEDVGLAGVVRAEVAAGLGVHGALEEGAEDGRADAAPVEAGAFQQGDAHAAVPIGDGQRLGEELSVDVFEVGQALVQVLLALFRRGVQQLEQAGQLRAEVGAVLTRLVHDVVVEGIELEDAGIVGEEDEEQAHEVDFQLLAGIAGGLELVVQLAHQLGGADVHGVLLAHGPRLVAGDEVEEADAFRQFLQGQFDFAALLQVMQHEACKIADDDVAGLLMLLYAMEVVGGLHGGLLQVAATALVLDQQQSGPEVVDLTQGIVQLAHVYFVAAHGACADAEDVEELVPEGLGVGLLVGGLLPVLHKTDGPGADLAAAERHGGEDGEGCG